MPRDYRNLTGKNAVREALKRAPGGKKRTKRKATNRSGTDLSAAARAARARTSNKREAAVQESTTKLMRKGVKSYADARSMAEYGHSERSTPKKASILTGLKQLGVGKTKRMKEATKLRKASKAKGKPAKAKTRKRKRK